MFKSKALAVGFIGLFSFLAVAQVSPAAVPLAAVPTAIAKPVKPLTAEQIRAQKVAEIVKLPYDFAAIDAAIANKEITVGSVKAALPKTIIPLEASALESNVLPFKKARLDIFLQGSKIHGIGKEFAVLSLDDEIRAVGLVSTGRSGHTTPSGRLAIFGFHKMRRSSTYGDAVMPYAIMLGRANDKMYFDIAIHGSFGESRGDPASHGCIRACTEGFNKGFHVVMWNLLNPKNILIADHLEDYVFGTWFDESKEQRTAVQEARYKTTVFTHSAASLKKVDGWKEALETLYPKDILLEGISIGRKSGGRGYKEFSAATHQDKIKLDHEELRAVYELERADYVVPKEFNNGQADRVQYDKRHLNWIK